MAAVFATANARANLLLNPGFELNPAGQTTSIVGWTPYAQATGNVLGIDNAGLAHGGSKFLKVSQSYNGIVNDNGAYQDHVSGPGTTYTATAWAYTSSGNQIAGANAAWIEVSFRNARGNILALYRSAEITASSFPVDTWIELPVTNQFNPGGSTLLGTVTSLVAPPDTSYVRYQILFRGDTMYSGGSVYFDDCAIEQVGGQPWGDWNIVWNDEFNGAAIDASIWTYDLGGGGWGNSELETYTSSAQNSFVSDGSLHIIARQQGSTSYTSARLKSQGLYSFTYGRIEFRAKFPPGLGFWPALWLLGTNFPSVGWPACGEVDVLEINGYYPQRAQGSIHSGTSLTKTYDIPNDSTTNWHTYLFEWTTNAVNWFVDGVRYETQTSWSSSIGPYPAPFDRPFFIIMNFAVGGNYVGNPTAATINAYSTFPAEMLVDYVRVYDHTPPLQLNLSVANSNVLLSWPSNIVCHLQSLSNAPILAPDASWADVPAAGNSFMLTPSNSSSLYRLSSP